MLAIVLGYKIQMLELYLHDLQTLKTDLAWTVEWTAGLMDEYWASLDPVHFKPGETIKFYNSSRN